VELRKAGITLPVLVMNPEESSFSAMVEHNLEPEIFSFFILDSFEKHLQASGIDNYPVHLKIDTGMHRLGFASGQIVTLAQRLAISKKLKVSSVFSHLIASENVKQDEFTNQQGMIFIEACSMLQQKLGYTFIKHLANTSAIHRHPNLLFDMVRLGIGLYGIDSDPEMQKQLKNVGTLKTTVAQISTAQKGESVGYGGTHLLENDTRVATVRIGYADGYPRSLSNGIGKMWINGRLVPVIGNVCMDMTMLNITGCADIKEGDEVIVYGEQLPVQQLAKWANTITYDIISGISQRVKRVYYDE
jgi:alanine racemase